MGDEKGDRPTGEGTKQIELTKLEKEAHLKEKEIESETRLKDRALDLEEEKLKLEGKKLDIAGEDRRLRSILLWSTGIFGGLASCVIVGLCLWFDQTAWLTVFAGTVLGLGVIGLSIRYGRSINFSGFGFSAKTETSKAEAEEPTKEPPSESPPPPPAR